MSAQRGTLDGLLAEVAKTLAPLRGELQAGPGPFFAELGIPLTAAQAAQLAGPLGAIDSTLGHLLDIGAQLDVAVATDSSVDTAALTVAGTARLAELIAALKGLTAPLQAMALPPTVPADVVTNVGRRIVDLLLVGRVAKERGLTELLELTGILERTDHDVDSSDPTRPFYTTNDWHPDRIGGWLARPAEQLQARFGFGGGGFDGTALLSLLDRLVVQSGLPALYQPGPPPSLDVVLVRLAPKLDVVPPGLAIGLHGTAHAGTIEQTGGPWRLALASELAVPSGSEVVLQPNGQVTVATPDGSPPSGKLRASWRVERPGAPVVILGQPGGSRLELETFEAYVEAVLTLAGGGARGTLGVGGEIVGGKAVITAGGRDGFLSKLLSGVDIQHGFAVQIGYTGADGLHFRGAGSLEIQLASHISLGPVDLTALKLSIGIAGSRFPVEITSDLKAPLGPLTVAVHRIGFALDAELTSGTTDGTFGPINVGARIVPPSGAALALDAGPVRGGGSIDYDPVREEYSGTLQLELLDLFSASAVGLITTRMPDGSKGFSLLLVIGVEFTPPLQLTWGFTLNAVGGIVGLNRSVALDRLRESVRTNAVSSIMFPRDVVANAPKIISDLREIFPPHEGRFVIGPMAKLGWGTPTLISLSLGVIIEIPGNIAIVGVLRIALPTEDFALVNLQVNFVGTLDFGRKMLTFDASLYESRILTMTLEGDMAVRLAWGSDAAFLISVGGFHPAFEPPPLELPSPMRRLCCSILDTSVARIRVESYQAITSNTVQFGARAEMFFGFDGVSVDGYIGFDALFQFSPFHFVIDISAGLTLHALGADVLSIRLRLTLEGPSPWRARGTGSVSILFWDIDVDFDLTWGDARNTTLPSVPVLPRVVADLSTPAHWKALPPTSSGLGVALAPLPASDTTILLHPAGALTVIQKVAPLDFVFDKVGSERPADVRRVAIESATSGAVPFSVTPIDDRFARAQYQDMSDAQKLSSPSFEPFHCGATLSASDALVKAGTAVRRDARYEVTIIDKEPQPKVVLDLHLLIGSIFLVMFKGSAVPLCAASQASKKLVVPYDDKPVAGPEQFVVVHADDNRPLAGAAPFAGEAMAQGHLSQLVAGGHAAHGQLHVVPAFEVNAA